LAIGKAEQFIVCTAGLVQGTGYMHTPGKDVNYSHAGKNCARHLGFLNKWPEIQGCMDLIEGGNFASIVKYERLTKEAGLKFTLWITVDGQWNEILNMEVRKDLLNFACHRYNGKLFFPKLSKVQSPMSARAQIPKT
jgi:hypothetical protein